MAGPVSKNLTLLIFRFLILYMLGVDFRALTSELSRDSCKLVLPQLIQQCHGLNVHEVVTVISLGTTIGY